MARRNTTDLCGILPFDKSSGPSSHDIINIVRRISGEGRVGHAGTLDPMATGLLVVLLGPATRLARFLTAESKTYRAKITFGSATDTDDADGEIISTLPVPSQVSEVGFVEACIEGLIGQRDQLPPAYSAIKLGGTKAYTVARRGETPELQPRTVRIDDARLITLDGGPPPTWDVELSVSKGTYIRSIARDLGSALGTAAHLSELRRSRSGTVDVGQAITADIIKGHSGSVSEFFIDPVETLGFPVIQIGDDQAAAASNGCRLSIDPLDSEPAIDTPLTVVDRSRIIGIFSSDGARLIPMLILPGDAPLLRHP
ncbi:MAG: tRNA pseudouridine(55) synthase TruB [Actinobacteria bacterium]|nr:tRNA pseudouridine(55) synthase TruB [Actinomycetota bacterium]MCL5887571.1 tRNA pseudouridine(55) synthase TruB [Actinomycetota bacterium]